MNAQTLKNDLKAVFTQAASETDATKQAEVIDALCEGIANAVYAFILSREITVSGIVTAGSATTQTQTVPVTATIQ